MGPLRWCIGLDIFKKFLTVGELRCSIFQMAIPLSPTYSRTTQLEYLSRAVEMGPQRLQFSNVLARVMALFPWLCLVTQLKNYFIKNCNPVGYCSNKTGTFEVRIKVPNYIIYDQRHQTSLHIQNWMKSLLINIHKPFSLKKCNFLPFIYFMLCKQIARQVGFGEIIAIFLRNMAILWKYCNHHKLSRLLIIN